MHERLPFATGANEPADNGRHGQAFWVPVGVLDHTIGIVVPVVAVALGFFGY